MRKNLLLFLLLLVWLLPGVNAGSKCEGFSESASDDILLNLLKQEKDKGTIPLETYQTLKTKTGNELKDGFYGALKRTDEAGGVVNGAGSIVFKQGEALSVYLDASGVAHNCVVVNVRPGTNGKYVIIGRSMGPVNKVAQDLENLVGKGKVRVLDDAYLSGQTFKLGDYDYVLPSGNKVSYSKGYKIFDKNGNVKYTLTGNDNWTVDMAWNDMVNNRAYREIKNSIGIIDDINYLENLPMFKLNRKWIEKIKADGYEVINISNPTSVESESLFFNMEKLIMNF